MSRCPKSNEVVAVPASAFIKARVSCPTCGRETAITDATSSGAPPGRGLVLARLAMHNRASASMPAITAIEICYLKSGDFDAHDMAMRVRDAIHAAIADADEISPWKSARTVEIGVGETAFRFVPPELDVAIRQIEENVEVGARMRYRLRRRR